MELLKVATWRRHPALAFVALCCAGIGSCVLMDSLDSAPPPFAFSHRVHVVDQGLGCVDCHRAWEKGDDPGMPSSGQCALCHEELDAEKPPERKVATLFVDKKYQVRNTTALNEEIVFSHQKHATRGDECVACHADIENNEFVTPALVKDMDDCMACHASRNASNDCAVCHAEIRAERTPPSHLQDWKRVHGAAVRARSERTVDRCELCHKESSCQSCHQNELPPSHNAYWRRRGHGLVASMDRQNCATCHTPDSCDRCHAESRPLDHTGMWGAPLDRHCIACHEPLRTQSCFVCHKGTPSHALATPLPPDHNAGMNCRMCHGNGQPLPHVDNGDTCTSCHL
jgi:hypothetical protein